ncbi:MAG TPA: phenylalanine--tRNA ligase subunit beta [Flavisolibacter sp.]
MTISYKWLSEYLPVQLEPERLSKILTAIGLEVEKTATYESVRGSLRGLIIAEVLETERHPNADKLTVTRVATGAAEPLQIVCGAPNVAPGQRVVVAPVGTTIYPVSGDPLTMKVAKIRGVESHGMICAEDEIGLGTSHDGIMVLPGDAPVGSAAASWFRPYTDTIFEIGLTPNRMDAMSHQGVARDVCAYLAHHEKKDYRPLIPQKTFRSDAKALPVSVRVENAEACRRYSGICIRGIEVKDSPQWLQDRLLSIGVRPINNIVDITNFIQHDTGQPLHAFDYDRISGQQVIVKTLPAGTLFTTLDEKERKLHEDDLMICDANGPMCIAGVFGGVNSGVTLQTTNIFLESAWFDPVSIRKTSFRHQLRTDAASRFEKGTDISGTVLVARRAAALITEIAGGTVAGEVTDIYPDPLPKTQVTIKYHYLKKLSGKNYHPDTVKRILEVLGFTIERDSMDALTVAVPYHKPDISLPADIVEEILRIDGLDNVPIPSTISISPSVEQHAHSEQMREKISATLTGAGFTEILTNSITNSAYFTEEQLLPAVKLLNNLSSELDIMRPSMLHTGLEVIAFNSNRKNTSLRLFEFGKTYSTSGTGKYSETAHLCLFVTGLVQDMHWKRKPVAADVYYIKGVSQAILDLSGITYTATKDNSNPAFESSVVMHANGEAIAEAGMVSKQLLSKFDIRHPVLFADFSWDRILALSTSRVQFKEIPKYPSVERDLALIVDKGMKYEQVRSRIEGLRLRKMTDVRLFDVFESEKIGAGKKSMAISFTFLDEEKTLTDKEIDSWMSRIMETLERDLHAEIRKS